MGKTVRNGLIQKMNRIRPSVCMCDCSNLSVVQVYTMITKLMSIKMKNTRAPSVEVNWN